MNLHDFIFFPLITEYYFTMQKVGKTLKYLIHMGLYW